MEKKRIRMYGKLAYFIYMDPRKNWFLPDVIAEFGFKPISMEKDPDAGSIAVCYSADGIVLHALIDPAKKPYLVVFDHAPRDIESYTAFEFGDATGLYKKDDSRIMDYVPEPLKVPYASFANANIKKIIVNDPAVIVFFEDGEKVVLKRREGDQFDLDDAISIALCQKMFGKAGYRKRLKKAKKNIYIQYLSPVASGEPEGLSTFTYLDRLLKAIKEIGDLDHAD